MEELRKFHPQAGDPSRRRWRLVSQGIFAGCSVRAPARRARFAPPTAGVAPSLRLEDAGDAKPAWITLLTTEHYNLQMQRVATISESNGRASVFLGAVSAGLIALGFESTRGAGPVGRMIF